MSYGLSYTPYNTNLFLKTRSNNPGPIVLDPDAQAFITAANITNATQQTAINNLVVGLKTDGLWTSMQALYPFVGGTSTTHKYNLKDPRNLDAAYRLNFYGGITHSSNGVILSGINSFIDTFYTEMGSGEIGAYNRGGVLMLGGKYSYWPGEDYPVFWQPRIETSTYSNGASTYFSNSFEQSSDPTNRLDSFGTNLNIGLIAFSGGAVVKYYKNGILNSSLIPDAGVSPLPISLWLGGVNYGFDGGGNYSNPTYANSQLAFGFITTTVLNNTQNINLYNHIQTYQTALNRQV
jgi:hypothetical protein